MSRTKDITATFHPDENLYVAYKNDDTDLLTRLEPELIAKAPWRFIWLSILCKLGFILKKG